MISSFSPTLIPLLTVLLVAVFLNLQTSVTACMIHGTDSGFCDTRYHPSHYSLNPSDVDAWKSESGNVRRTYIQLSKQFWQPGSEEGPCMGEGTGDSCLGYCGRYLFGYKSVDNFYVPCVPRPSFLPKDRNFPDGRFLNHTPHTKDMWIMNTVDPFIQYRRRMETNERNIKKGVDEYGHEGETAVHFDKNPDCEMAFKAFMCWLNFPRCDMTTQESMPMCKSACENMFQVCGYSKDMWRCGDADFFNGYQMETPSPIKYEGQSQWKRDFFPGSPFVKNEFGSGKESERKPKPVCTPSFLGAGEHAFRMKDLVIFKIIVGVVSVILLVAFV